MSGEKVPHASTGLSLASPTSSACESMRNDSMVGAVVVSGLTLRLPSPDLLADLLHECRARSYQVVDQRVPVGPRTVVSIGAKAKETATLTKVRRFYLPIPSPLVCKTTCAILLSLTPGRAYQGASTL